MSTRRKIGIGRVRLHRPTRCACWRAIPMPKITVLTANAHAGNDGRGVPAFSCSTCRGSRNGKRSTGASDGCLRCRAHDAGGGSRIRRLPDDAARKTVELSTASGCGATSMTRRRPCIAQRLDLRVARIRAGSGREDPAARLVACPGCYPTAALLALVPLAKARLIDVDDIVIDAKSGVTGAGKG